jgi:hypothetical protein
MNPFNTILLSLALILSGCAYTQQTQPFKQSNEAKKIAAQTNVSKITIFASNKSSMRKMLALDFAPGAISLNGENLGEFSKNEQIFSHELSPGSNDITVGALKLKLNTEPNTHYFYEYGFGLSHWGVASTMDYSLKLIEKKPYKDVTAVKINEKQSPSKSNDFEGAKKICIDLGFKPGTESFGNCVLRVAN